MTIRSEVENKIKVLQDQLKTFEKNGLIDDIDLIETRIEENIPKNVLEELNKACDIYSENTCQIMVKIPLNIAFGEDNNGNIELDSYEMDDANHNQKHDVNFNVNFITPVFHIISFFLFYQYGKIKQLARYFQSRIMHCRLVNLEFHFVIKHHKVY